MSKKQKNPKSWFRCSYVLFERTDLSITEKVIYSLLCDRRRILLNFDKGENIWAGYNRIGKWTGVSRSTVIRAIEKLVRVNAITAQSRDFGQSNQYQIATGWPECQNDTGGCQNDTTASQADTGDSVRTTPNTDGVHHTENIKLKKQTPSPPIPPDGGSVVGGASLKKPGCSEKPDVAAGVTPAPVLPPKVPSLPPVPTKVEPATKTDEQFEQFWKAYPRKVAKMQARKVWGKLKPNAELLERILSAIETQSKSEQWTRDGGQFIPHPGTWLNQERWDDEDVAGSSGGMTRHEELDRAFGKSRNLTEEEYAIAFGVDLEEVQ